MNAGDSGEDWVARVGDSDITVSDYRDSYRDYVLSTGLPDTPKRRSDYLERLISVRLLAIDGEERRLDETETFAFEWDRVQQKLMIDGFVKTEVLAPITVSQEELRDMFVRVNTRLKASHLFAETLEEANRLKTRLDQGESFEELAREVFSTEALRENGGSVGEFGFDEMDPAFEDAAYRMQPGQISDPVKTIQGYSIIRLDHRFTNPILTESEFAERIDGLRRYVLVRKHDVARDELRSEILDQLDPDFEAAVADALVGELTGENVLQDGEELLPEAVLVRHSQGAMTVAQFMERARFTSDRQRAAVSDLSSLEEFAKGLLIRQELIRRAEGADIHQTDAFAVAERRERLDLLYELAWNDIETAIEVPDDSIEAHLARFPDEFEIPAQVRVRELLVSTASDASALGARLTVSNFADLAAQHSIRDGSAQTGGDLGYVTREQLGILAAPVFDAATGSIVGPLSVGRRFAFFHVMDKSTARTATVEEARIRVEDQLRAAWVRKAVRDRANELRQEIPVVKQSMLLTDIPLRSPETPSVATLNP